MIIKFFIFSTSNNLDIASSLALNNTINYKVITDKTSILIRINSSNHIHAPHLASPLNKAVTATKSVSSELLYTTHCFAIDLVKSFVDYVFLVPVGTSGVPHILNFNVFIKVK